MHEKSQNCYDNNVNFNQVMSDSMMRDNASNRCVDQEYKYMKYSEPGHLNMNNQSDQISQIDSSQSYPEHLQYFYNNYQQHNMVNSPQQQFLPNYEKEYISMNEANIDEYTPHCNDSYIMSDNLQRYQQPSPNSEHILRQSNAPPMAPLSTPSPPLLPPNTTVPRIKQEEDFSVILADVRKTCYSS